MRRAFPFKPKSTRFLEPGDFWALPLRDGSFACGRVIELPSAETPGARVSFLAGLLDWHGDKAPEARAIAGARCLAQGVCHLKAITTTGGAILGNRPLSLDGIEAWIFNDGGTVRRGFKPLQQAATPFDKPLPPFATWGYNVIRLRAEKELL